MEVKFDKLNNVTAEITVTVDENDYADKVKKQLKEVAKERVEPGFRKGHVPEGLIKKKFGAAVKYDVVNNIVRDALFDYIRDNNIEMLGQPVADKDNVYKEDATEYVFKFKVGIAPVIESPVNKNLHVPYYEIEVTDDMINNEEDALRQRFGRQVSGDETEPNAVIKGIITELNPDGTVKEDGIVVENGILAPIHFKSDEQKKLFEGKKKGDIVIFNPSVAADNNVVELSSMLNIDKADVANHKGDFNFHITDIIVLRPAELDQEFFDQAVGKDRVHSEAELKEEIKKLIQSTFGNDSDYKFSIDSREAILNAVGKIELPDEILKDFLMKQQKELTPENIDEEYVKILPILTWDILKGQLEKDLDVKVTDEDIKNEARGLVIRQLNQYGNGMLTEQLVNHYADEVMKDEKNHRMLYNNALDYKLNQAVKANVTLDVKPVTIDEFRNFFKQPETAEEA